LWDREADPQLADRRVASCRPASGDGLVVEERDVGGVTTANALVDLLCATAGQADQEIDFADRSRRETRGVGRIRQRIALPPGVERTGKPVLALLGHQGVVSGATAIGTSPSSICARCGSRNGGSASRSPR